MSSTVYFLKENKGMAVSFNLTAGWACIGMARNFQMFLQDYKKVDQGVERIFAFAQRESQNVKD